MKTKHLLSLLILFLAGFGYAQEWKPEWEYVCTLIGERPRKVCAQGTDTVYVVGENGLIAKSADKGLTWEKIYISSKETLNDIVFYNHDIGFAAGNNGIMLRTRNSGASWEQINSGTDQNINAIAIFDLNNIWAIGGRAIGNNCLIIHSADMGETWLTKSLLSDDRYLTDIKNKGNRGYIAGKEIVLSTEDGGATWQERISTKYTYFRSLSITENKVYVLGNDDILFSEDNVNWRILNTEFLIAFASSVYFQDDQNGFRVSYDISTCGDCSMYIKMDKTIDGGNTWQELYYRAEKGNYPDSNFSFSTNNEFGYCLLGKRLMRTPYTGEFEYCENYTEINVVESENPVINLHQHENELQINSAAKSIVHVDIFSLTGIKQQQAKEQAKEIGIDINHLPKGIYLVKVLFSDNTSYSVQWIKY